MSHAKVHDKATEVESAAGEVMLSGPDGVALSMTPEAASETGARLIESAAEAKGKAEIEADLQRRSEASKK